MRVVTTASKQGLENYGYRWLESRKNWPVDTEFRWYTEGYTIDCPGKDMADVPGFAEWKLRHAFFLPPAWRWDVVRYAHKVFAAIDALLEYDGVGVWLDADCVTFKPIPPGLIEAQVQDAYVAHYGRTGHYTETGLWIMNCAHPEHAKFLTAWKNIYLSGKFRQLGEWHDCMTLDATLRRFKADGRITTKNLSGAHHLQMHPQALTELGQYIDHCKGPRKSKGYSAENAHHAAEVRGMADLPDRQTVSAQRAVAKAGH